MLDASPPTDHIPLQQSSGFARALRMYGTSVVSTDPVILQRRFGPLGQVGFASRVRPCALNIRPRIINAETDDTASYKALGYRQIVTPAHIAEWDLAQPNLRVGLHGKWRNRLVKGEASSLSVRLVVWDGSPHPLFAHSQTLARDRRFRSLPAMLLSTFARSNPGDALLFEAHSNDALFAACLVLRHGATATYQTAWSSPEGLNLQAPRLLLWGAARHLADLGHTLFDLGTVETETAPGLARFKLGTGAKARSLGGTWLRLR